MNHHHSSHRSPHVHRLMGTHHSSHSSSHHGRPVDKLIRGHHAEGGDIGRMAIGGGMPMQQFKKGGKAHHHCHKKMAMGGAGKFRKGMM